VISAISSECLDEYFRNAPNNSLHANDSITMCWWL